MQQQKPHASTHQIIQLVFCLLHSGVHLHHVRADSGCTADEELWDELDEEVPAEWDDDQPARKRTGKPVPPGEYFTIIRGVPNTSVVHSVCVQRYWRDIACHGHI